MLEFCSFLSNILLDVSTTFCLSIHPLVDTWTTSFWHCESSLLWTWVCKYLSPTFSTLEYMSIIGIAELYGNWAPCTQERRLSREPSTALRSDCLFCFFLLMVSVGKGGFFLGWCPCCKPSQPEPISYHLHGPQTKAQRRWQSELKITSCRQLSPLPFLSFFSFGDYGLGLDYTATVV